MTGDFLAGYNVFVDAKSCGRCNQNARMLCSSASFVSVSVTPRPIYREVLCEGRYTIGN